MSEYIYGTDGHEGHWLTGEEIVRCRDCKHYDAVINSCNHPRVTPFFRDTPANWIFTPHRDGFCAWGERRDG